MPIILNRKIETTDLTDYTDFFSIVLAALRLLYGLVMLATGFSQTVPASVSLPGAAPEWEHGVPCGCGDQARSLLR